MTRIFTTALYGGIDVTESYDYIKNIMYRYTRNGLVDGFIELHFTKSKFINHPISLKLSSIVEFFDITKEETND